MLLEVASSVDRALTEQHIRRMGLDPQADHKFLVDLLETYGIDVMLMIDTSCCFWGSYLPVDNQGVFNGILSQMVKTCLLL